MDKTTATMITINALSFGVFFYFWNRKVVNDWFRTGKAKEWATTWLIGLPMVLVFLAVVALFLGVLMK